MNGFGRRARFLLGLGVLAVPLSAAAVAYGCTAAAILLVNPSSSQAGSTVTVSGKYFKDTHVTDAPQPVEIRLGSVTGAALATAEPAGTDGTFSTKVTIPAATPAGDTFFSATQLSANGTPSYGTPARQAFKVLPATPSSRGSVTPRQGATTVAAPTLPALSLASARRLARARIKAKHPKAKRIRVRCARRSRTAAKCTARFKLGSKSRKRSVVVTSAQLSTW